MQPRTTTINRIWTHALLYRCRRSHAPRSALPSVAARTHANATSARTCVLAASASPSQADRSVARRAASAPSAPSRPARAHRPLACRAAHSLDHSRRACARAAVLRMRRRCAAAPMARQRRRQRKRRVCVSRDALSVRRWYSLHACCFQCRHAARCVVRTYTTAACPKKTSRVVHSATRVRQCANVARCVPTKCITAAWALLSSRAVRAATRALQRAKRRAALVPLAIFISRR